MPDRGIENLHVPGADKPMLKGLDLSVSKGEVHALMGPNGSGKVLCSHHADDERCATKLLWTRVQGGVIGALARTTLAELVAFAANELPSLPSPSEGLTTGPISRSRTSTSAPATSRS